MRLNPLTWIANRPRATNSKDGRVFVSLPWADGSPIVHLDLNGAKLSIEQVDGKHRLVRSVGNVSDVVATFDAAGDAKCALKKISKALTTTLIRRLAKVVLVALVVYAVGNSIGTAYQGASAAAIASAGGPSDAQLTEMMRQAQALTPPPMPAPSMGAAPSPQPDALGSVGLGGSGRVEPDPRNPVNANCPVGKPRVAAKP